MLPSLIGVIDFLVIFDCYFLIIDCLWAFWENITTPLVCWTKIPRLWIIFCEFFLYLILDELHVIIGEFCDVNPDLLNNLTQLIVASFSSLVQNLLWTIPELRSKVLLSDLITCWQVLYHLVIRANFHKILSILLFSFYHFAFFLRSS